MRWEKVLVTGGRGRLGRYVVEELDGDCHISVLDRPGQGSPPIDFSVDVLDLEGLSVAMRGQDAVIHLAGIDASVSASAELVFDTNVRGTWNVLNAAYNAGVRKVVICTSVSALGLDYTNPHLRPLYLPIDEAHPLRPSQAYGLSKQLDESIAQSFASRGRMDVICLRPAWVMFPDTVRKVVAEGWLSGARGAMSSDDTGRRREPLPLLRSYVGPEDAARCFRLALELSGTPYDVFLVTAEDTFEAEATLVHLERAYGSLPDVRKPEIYLRNPRSSAYDISHAREILGWTPRSKWADLTAGIAEVGETQTKASLPMGDPPSGRA
jgi:nucleoside-diphosphate-sugar epimerase